MRSKTSRHKGALSVLVVLVLAMAFAVTGCGSDDEGSSDSGGSTKGEGIRAGTGDRAEKAKQAGEQAAEEVGGPIDMPKGKTIGIINFLGGIESSDRLKSTATVAAKKLGFKVIQCDGKGTPSEFVACGNSLLDRGVDGIIEVAIEPGQIQPVLDKANAKNVPVIQVGGGSVPNGDLAGNYGPDEARAGKLLSDAIFERLPEGGEVAIQDFPAAWGATRTDEFRKAVEGQDKIKIAADYETDAATLVPFTQKAVADNLTKNPDLKGYWFTFDTTGAVGGQVIQAKYKGKEAEKPLVFTFHADLGTLELMEAGAIDVTSEVNYDSASWMGVDQLAEFFARGTEPSKENQPDWPVVGDLFTYSVIDKTNLPPKGEYVEPEWDVPTYFESKWAAEFNTAG